MALATQSLHAGKILALALLARLLVLWFAVVRFPHNWLYTRGIELGTLGQSLVTGHGLSSPFGGSTGPTALLSPGYPAVIALFFRVFGSFTFTAAIAIMGMQLLFSVATVFLIMHVAQRCFGARAANLAGTFWAVSLPLLWMPTIFWETCLSAMLLVGMIALALHSEQHPKWPLWPGMGAYCGFTALVNPALLLSLLAMLGWTAWQTRKSLRYSPLLGVLVFLLIFTPWPLRNWRVLGAFIPLRTTVGFELWVGNRPGATGYLDVSQFPLFNRWEYTQYVTKGEVRYMKDKSALAKAYIRAHPVEFLRLTAIRCMRFWTGSGNQDGSVVFVIHALLTSLLAAIGLGRLLREHRWSVAVLFLLPLILFPLPYYISHAEFRYRLVIDPLLTILAGFGVCGLGGSDSSVKDL